MHLKGHFSCLACFCEGDDWDMLSQTAVQRVHCTTLGWVILVVCAVVSLSPGCSCNTQCMGVLGTQRKPTPLFRYEGPQCLMRNILPSGGGPVLEMNFFCGHFGVHSWEERPRESPGHEHVGWEEAGVKADPSSSQGPTVFLTEWGARRCELSLLSAFSP